MTDDFDDILATQHDQIEGTTMDPVTQQKWNDWVDQRIDAKISAALEMLADEFGGFIGERERLLRDQLQKLLDTDKLVQADLRELRDALAVQRAIDDGSVEILRGTVSSRKRDAYQ